MPEHMFVPGATILHADLDSYYASVEHATTLGYEVGR